MCSKLKVRHFTCLCERCVFYRAHPSVEAADKEIHAFIDSAEKSNSPSAPPARLHRPYHSIPLQFQHGELLLSLVERRVRDAEGKYEEARRWAANASELASAIHGVTVDVHFYYLRCQMTLAGYAMLLDDNGDATAAAILQEGRKLNLDLPASDFVLIADRFGPGCSHHPRSASCDQRFHA